MLAARAFVAEVEREKIAERTMRGKAERARGGRLPQGTGAGCYGYTYSRATGRREVDPSQAATVVRIFSRYAKTRSFSAVARELNEAGIPALGGGRWYPPTIRRVLLNESYIGRTVYRRTKRVITRSRTGVKTSRVVDQPIEQHIEIPDATPAIVPDMLWRRVRDILEDPERRGPRQTSRHYVLRGRLRCGVCNSAMVGQTLTSRGHEYLYYRCRHSYTKGTGQVCPARYVPGSNLETGVWNEISAVLSRPDLVIRERKRRMGRTENPKRAAEVKARLKSLDKQEERLVRLYGMGEVAESAIRPALAEVRRDRDTANAELTALEPPAALEDFDQEALQTTCSAIADWIKRADQSQRELVLEALQVKVTATKEEAIVEGVLPFDELDFSPNSGSELRERGFKRRLIRPSLLLLADSK